MCCTNPTQMPQIEEWRIKLRHLVTRRSRRRTRRARTHTAKRESSFFWKKQRVSSLYPILVLRRRACLFGRRSLQTARPVLARLAAWNNIFKLAKITMLRPSREISIGPLVPLSLPRGPAHFMHHLRGRIEWNYRLR